MKVGNLVDGLAVVDVKRVNKMNLIQFTKAVSEYIELGYKIDVHSSRQVGLVLQCDVFKLESNVGCVGDTSTEGIVETEDVVKESEPYNPENVVLKINGVEVEGFNIEEPDEKLEKVETVDDVTEESLADLKEGNKESDEGVVSSETEVVEQTTPPVKKTRTKKTT